MGFYFGDCFFEGIGDSNFFVIGVVDVDGEVLLDWNNFVVF